MEEQIFNVESTWHLWLGSLLWTLIGIAFVKTYTFPYGQKTFSWKYWIKNNTRDVILGLLGTLILMKVGDAIIKIASAVGLDTNGVATVLQDVNLNPVQLALVVAIIVQWKLHLRKEKKKEL